MKLKLFILFIGTIFFSCEEDQSGVGLSRSGNGGSGTGGDWLIPKNQVFDGGPGRDGIPALETPERAILSEDTYLIEPEFVVGYYDGEKAVAYPHQILDWHEIINDNVNSFPLAITYCPLTGTAIGWDRTINGKISTFGVSGLIYNNNLIPFDRQTGSNWSQARLDCVNGSLIKTKISTFPLVETRWATWKEMYPETEYITLNTGHDRTYGQYPYGDYRTNENNLLFPLSIDDRRLNRKERVHGIISSETTRVYRFESFSDQTTLINDVIDGNEVLILGDASRNFIVSFYATLEDGTMPNFSASNNNNIILIDNQGNSWDVFGFAVSGPRTGERLRSTQSFMGYWFVWGTFYSGAEVY